MIKSIIIAILLIYIIVQIFKHYSPRIEIIEFAGKYSVFLWYNEWEGLEVRRRCKSLFMMIKL